MKFEQPPIQSKNNSAKQEKQEKNSSELDAAIKMLEYETKRKMPEDREELFQNFDNYVPKDLKEIIIATQPTPTMFDRKGIKERLEKVLYGSTIKEIDGYLDAEMEKIGKIDETQEAVEHDRLVEANNDLNSGNFTIPLAYIERKIVESAGEERENLRNFAQRLTQEIYRDRPKMGVDSNKILDHLNKERSFLLKQGSEFLRGEAIDYENAIKEIGQGNPRSALSCIENDIHFIQRNLIDLSKRDTRNSAKEILQGRYGENFQIIANQELEKFRNYREFLRGKTERMKPIKEKSQPKNEHKKEKLEGEELFKYQVENNSHPSAKSLKEDFALFYKSISDSGSEPQFLKEELSEILYRNNLEYIENEDVKVNEKDEKIFGPLLNFRKEMDSWDTFTDTRKMDFQKRIEAYLKDTFGVETHKPEEGEKFDAKKNMQAVKVEKTGNEFLDYKIKRVGSPGFKINDNLFDYYKKWYSDKEQEMREKWNSIKNATPREEFDEVMGKDRAWLKKYLFAKFIKPAYVEIYRYQ